MSWTTLPVTEQQVRDYLNMEGTTGRYSDQIIGSNIRAAANRIQRWTHRQFEPQSNTTKTFTTEGKAYIAIPDLRSASAVTLESSSLTADSTYWLREDAHHSGVYTGIQFRTFGGRGDSYLAHPDWFDRNLDRDWARGIRGSLPNDLSIVGNWGWSPYPEDFLHAVKILAAFYTKRPASVLADSQVTPEGNQLSYAQLPIEVREFIEEWQGQSQVAVID